MIRTSKLKYTFWGMSVAKQIIVMAHIKAQTPVDITANPVEVNKTGFALLLTSLMWCSHFRRFQGQQTQ
jgi:bacteriorhodopsin